MTLLCEDLPMTLSYGGPACELSSTTPVWEQYCSLQWTVPCLTLLSVRHTGLLG
jgi:hypothetical protein